MKIKVLLHFKFGTHFLKTIKQNTEICNYINHIKKLIKKLTGAQLKSPTVL